MRVWWFGYVGLLVRCCGDAPCLKSKVFVNPDVYIDGYYVTVVKEKLHMLYFLRIGFGMWVMSCFQQTCLLIAAICATNLHPDRFLVPSLLWFIWRKSL